MFFTGTTLLTPLVGSLMVVWPGSEQMNWDGPVMPARRLHCITTPCSSTNTCLLLRLWQVSGR